MHLEKVIKKVDATVGSNGQRQEVGGEVWEISWNGTKWHERVGCNQDPTTCGGHTQIEPRIDRYCYATPDPLIPTKIVGPIGCGKSPAGERTIALVSQAPSEQTQSEMV